MRLEGIELRFIVNRISDQLDGRHRVDGILSIKGGGMLFRLRHPAKDDLFLVVSAFGVWETSLRPDPAGKSVQSAPGEDDAPGRDPFGATVKSQYGRASVPVAGRMPRHDKIRDSLLQTRLVGIEQPGAERVAYLTFEGPGGEFVMVVDLSGRGNAILCSGRPEMEILALARPVRGKSRAQSVGVRYVPPPGPAAGAPDILDLSERDFAGLRGSETPVWEWLVHRLGLPYKYVGGVLDGMEAPYATGAELGGGQIRSIFRDTAQLVRAVTAGPHTPCIVRSAMIQNASPDGFLAVGVPLDITDLAYERIPSLAEVLDLVFMASLWDPW